MPTIDTPLIRLLFVSARPQGSDHIRFQEEHERIKRLLPSSFEVIAVRSASVRELRQALIDHRPHILHFAGHGEEREGALLLEGRGGEVDPIRPHELGRLFEALASHYQPPYAVLLNACHCLAAAQEIEPYVPLVIGMAGSLGDDEALEFADAFYHALRAGNWTGAFQMGRLALTGIDQDLPQLLAWDALPASPWQNMPARFPLPPGYQGPVPSVRFLTSTQRAALIDFLAARHISSLQWEEMLGEAFYHADPPLYQSIDRAGPPRDFAICLVQALESYGYLPVGKLALVALLSVAREEVGTDWQARIDEWLRELGVPGRGATRRELEIAYLEQRLAVLAHLQRQAAETFRPVEMEQRAFEDIVQRMAEIRRAVLLGQPGAGKTTLLHKLEEDAIGRALADEAAPIPLFVPLGQWLEANENLESFIGTQLGALGSYLGELLRENRALLLLDSLNEIPVGQQEEKVEQVKCLLRTHPNLVALITCRKEDYRADLDLALDRLEIALLEQVPPISTEGLYGEGNLISKYLRFLFAVTSEPKKVVEHLKREKGISSEITLFSSVNLALAIIIHHTLYDNLGWPLLSSIAITVVVWGGMILISTWHIYREDEQLGWALMSLHLFFLSLSSLLGHFMNFSWNAIMGTRSNEIYYLSVSVITLLYWFFMTYSIIRLVSRWSSYVYLINLLVINVVFRVFFGTNITEPMEIFPLHPPTPTIPTPIPPTLTIPTPIPLTILGISFDPPSPASTEQVKIFSCTEGNGGVDITMRVSVNRQPDGSNQGEWLSLTELGLPCFGPENAPTWNTAGWEPGEYQVRVEARDSKDPLWQHPAVLTTTYTLLPLATPTPAPPALTVNWDFGELGQGKVFLNICSVSEPYVVPTNPGCEDTNVVNRDELAALGATKIKDKFKYGHSYRVALVADNLPGRPGRWVAAYDVTMLGDETVEFTLENLVFFR